MNFIVIFIGKLGGNFSLLYVVEIQKSLFEGSKHSLAKICLRMQITRKHLEKCRIHMLRSRVIWVTEFQVLSQPLTICKQRYSEQSIYQINKWAKINKQGGYNPTLLLSGILSDQDLLSDQGGKLFRNSYN